MKTRLESWLTVGIFIIFFYALLTGLWEIVAFLAKPPVLLFLLGIFFLIPGSIICFWVNDRPIIPRGWLGGAIYATKLVIATSLFITGCALASFPFSGYDVTQKTLAQMKTAPWFILSFSTVGFWWLWGLWRWFEEFCRDRDVLISGSRPMKR